MEGITDSYLERGNLDVARRSENLEDSTFGGAVLL
jgi:hypothetical protein